MKEKKEISKTRDIVFAEICDIDGDLLLIRTYFPTKCARYPTFSEFWVRYDDNRLVPVGFYFGTPCDYSWHEGLARTGIALDNPELPLEYPFYEYIMPKTDRAAIPRAFFKSITQRKFDYDFSSVRPKDDENGRWTHVAPPGHVPLGKHSWKERTTNSEGLSLDAIYEIELSGKTLLEYFLYEKTVEISGENFNLKGFYDVVKNDPQRAQGLINECGIPYNVEGVPPKVNFSNSTPWFVLYKDCPVFPLDGYCGLNLTLSEGQVVTRDDLIRMVKNQEICHVTDIVCAFPQSLMSEKIPHYNDYKEYYTVWQMLIKTTPSQNCYNAENQNEEYYIFHGSYVGRVSRKEIEDAFKNTKIDGPSYLPLAAYTQLFKPTSRIWPCNYLMPKDPTCGLVRTVKSIFSEISSARYSAKTCRYGKQLSQCSDLGCIYYSWNLKLLRHGVSVSAIEGRYREKYGKYFLEKHRRI